jgi:cell shape-determining protein MreC
MTRVSYLFLGVVLFLLLNWGQEKTDRLRARVASFCSPLWRAVAFAAKEPSHHAEEIELYLARSELEELREILVRQPKGISSATPGKVLFRDPNHWGNTIWIALGEEDNRDRVLIGKNSPVLLGNSLIGVVEYVGTAQSRIRLITDAGLTIAVRVVRGEAQNRQLLECFELLLDNLRARPDLFSSVEEQDAFLKSFIPLKERMQGSKEELLAKGELQGKSAPLWYSLSPILSGIGFNYDFADREGPARDLRRSALLKVGDLLVTSGLDGVFPSGIPVAFVTKIHPLKESDFFYRLEAKPTAGTLQELRTVFVLPPI